MREGSTKKGPEVKLFRNLLTSYEKKSMAIQNGYKDIPATTHEKRPQKKRIQAPYLTKKIKTKEEDFNLNYF